MKKCQPARLQMKNEKSEMENEFKTPHLILNKTDNRQRQ